MKRITVYISGNTESDPTVVLSPPTPWRQPSGFVWNRQSGQILAAACMGFAMDKMYLIEPHRSFGSYYCLCQQLH
jgi:hypothetical protein